MLSYLLKALEKCYIAMSPEDLNVAANAISAIMDTEAYQTHRDKFLPTLEDKKRLLTLNGKIIFDLNINLLDAFISSLCSTYERKKELRPLLDSIQRFKYLKSKEEKNNSQKLSK